MAGQILTTFSGSYPAPAWLLMCQTREAIIDASAMVLQTQAALGIDLPTDGELVRFDRDHPESNGMVEYFIRRLRNVRTEISRTEERMFRSDSRMDFRTRAAGVVEGQLGEGTLNLPSQFQQSRGLTRGPLKFCVTSPYMLARTLVDRHYKSLEDRTNAISDILASQLAEIDADVIQVNDEAIAGEPADAQWVVQSMIRLLGAVPKKAAMRIGFGNYNGQSTRTGTYAPLIGFLNQLPLDHVLVENACRDVEELSCFRDMRPQTGVCLGVIDVKKNAIETPEEIARHIERASRVMGAGRITYAGPDNGMWMLRRTVVDAKLAALVKGRDLFLGQRPA